MFFDLSATVRASRTITIALLLALLIVPAALITSTVAHGQTAEETAKKRAELQSQLNELESQIAQTQGALTRLRGEGQSIERDISILDAGIKKSQLQIRATQVQIDALSQNITIHSKTAETLTEQLQSEKESVEDILRKTQQLDDYSLVEVVLSTEDVSTFFGDLDAFAALKRDLYESSQTLDKTRTATLSQKDQLEEQHKEQQKLKTLQANEQAKIVSQQAQKKTLLAANKSTASQYQSIFNEQQRTAAQIRAALFALAGGQGGIPFGTAVDNAKIASRISGVRPAMILAILSQESDLGKNVGQCLVTDLTTGDGKGKNTGTPFPGTMKSPRDTVPFQRLMDALGRDWSTTPISCPQPGGYGGAMGPTQFIPSTWVMYEARIKGALNVAAADPFSPLHAIVATGLYLQDVGAGAGTRAAEHTSAAKYFAGGNWAVAGQAYANSVMEKAARFQADIDTLDGS